MFQSNYHWSSVLNKSGGTSFLNGFVSDPIPKRYWKGWENDQNKKIRKQKLICT